MTTINDTAAVVAATPTASSTSSSSATLSSDFGTYLKMLTVQMENQDPLDPADASEFSVQLATFSALEQQVLTNQLLEQMLNASGGASDMGMINALGKKALVRAEVTYDGIPIDLRVPDLPNHDSAELKVLNEFGGTVATIPIEPGTRALTWPPEGQKASTTHALYRFMIDTHQTDGPSQSTPALAPQTVSEVMRTDTGFDLILANGSVHRSDAITGFME